MFFLQGKPSAHRDQENMMTENMCMGCGKSFTTPRGLRSHQSQKFQTAACRPVLLDVERANTPVPTFTAKAFAGDRELGFATGYNAELASFRALDAYPAADRVFVTGRLVEMFG